MEYDKTWIEEDKLRELPELKDKIRRLLSILEDKNATIKRLEEEVDDLKGDLNFIKRKPWIKPDTNTYRAPGNSYD
jgi:chromosome segregation ATPase